MVWHNGTAENMCMMTEFSDLSADLNRSEQLIQQHIILYHIPVRYQTQCVKQRCVTEARISRSAVFSAGIASETPPAQGNVTPFFADAHVANVDKAVEFTVLQKDVGQTVISMGQRRLGGHLVGGDFPLGIY